ncbi:uncharacterized protein LOC124469629 isoform X3 [Hypomesus transpacificus]|uniref:uncharacterized protein LOC124469629 isoform X3 n=1 Tax=Hypomesus transpacificus TaxID=137520 RepID=UPI001F080392|nr:uncharacterized protein LOC124469629 isoform X3 [Hypomesus transpacificus]
MNTLLHSVKHSHVYDEEEVVHFPPATPSYIHPAPVNGSHFEWQLFEDQSWLRIANQHVIETHYCQPGAAGITLNTSSRMTTQSTALQVRRLSILPAGQSEDVGWYFRDDRLWCEYGLKGASVSSSDLEQQFIQNPLGNFQFKVRHQSYCVDFSAMNQTNQTTHVQRKVRRRPKFNTLISVNISPAPALLMPPAGVVWEYMGEEGVWMEYQAYTCSYDSVAIERHYQHNTQGQLRFKAGRFHYTLDFTGMFQTNVSTGTCRAVRRTQGHLQATRAGPRWHFRDMDGTWREYSKSGGCSVSSQDIEISYQQDSGGTLTFTTRTSTYQLCFSTMTQRNLSTNTTRAVQRLDQ